MTTLSGAFVDVKNLIPGSLLDVETKTRHYRIECVGGNEVRISGHPEHCPDPVLARLHGSIGKEGVFEFGMIGRGMRLMVFLNNNRPVTTSRVVSIRLDRPKSPPLKSSSSMN
jgi:hypothetical protein